MSFSPSSKHRPTSSNMMLTDRPSRSIHRRRQTRSPTSGNPHNFYGTSYTHASFFSDSISIEEERLVAKGNLHQASTMSSQNGLSPTPATHSGSIHRLGNASAKLQNGKKEERPQKTGMALWRGLAAVIRFKVLAKNAPTQDQDHR